MDIGNLRLEGNLMLAPMSSVTNLPFRLLCRRYGASLVYSEMVFSEAVLQQSEKSMARVFTCEEEKPLGVQLLGSDAGSLVNSARIITESCMPQVIDVNLGCPAKSVINTGCGAELLKKPDDIGEIIEQLSGSLDIPLTAKMRVLGDAGKTLEVAHIIERAGADALIVHGRTQKQKYSGKSNLDIIKRIKRELFIPVIANGDIADERTAKHVLEYTQCDGLMIGRAAIGNPYIFRRIAHYLREGELLQPQTLHERLEDFFEYVELCRRYGILTFRDLSAKAMWFTKGLENIKPVRIRLNGAKDEGSILGVMNGLRGLN
ncbi:MAG: tRNA dihydrouridine synthase DusB [Candidatus Methanoperedens sp.]|nr:tRNA dihydrouridine synthase DusB [Candidatus Methanoperedens sp.]